MAKTKRVEYPEPHSNVLRVIPTKYEADTTMAANVAEYKDRERRFGLFIPRDSKGRPVSS